MSIHAKQRETYLLINKKDINLLGAAVLLQVAVDGVFVVAAAAKKN